MGKGKGSGRSKGEQIVDRSLVDQGSLLVQSVLSETSTKRRSLYTSDVEAEAEVVDTQAERRALRRSEAAQKETVKEKSYKATISEAQTLASKLTPEELESHYARCIQLYSQNKVNTKNAFRLQLIDFMKMAVSNKSEKSNNLTLMSCTLDASAKIYSCRVDKVYSDLTKLMSGKNFLKDKDEEAGERDAAAQDNPDEDSEEEKVVKKKSKTCLDRDPYKFVKGKEKSVEEKEWLELSCYGDALPRGLDHFLSLPVQSEPSLCLKNSGPLLDSTEPSDAPAPHALMPFDLPECGESVCDFNKCISDYWRIGEGFVVADDDQDEGENSFTYNPVEAELNAEHEPPPISGDMSEEECEAGGTVLDYDDSSGEEGEVGSPGAMPPPPTPPPPVPPSQPPMTPSTPAMRRTRSRSSLSASNMVRLLRHSHSEYSFFDESKLAFLPSSSHWKIKPVQREAGVRKTPGGGRSTKKQQNQYLRLEAEELEVLIDKVLAQTKKKTTLSMRTIQTWQSNQTKLLLPITSRYYKLDKIFRLFKNENVSFVKNIASELDLDSSTILTPNDFTDELSGDHQNDSDDDFARDFLPMEDEEGGVPEMPEDGAPEQEPDVEVSDTTAPPHQPPSLLVPLLKKVDVIKVPFATRQKRIDIKKLKQQTWQVIHSAPDGEGKENENNNSRSNASAAEMRFSRLYNCLMRDSPSDVSSELSLPICFTALLYLANEKNLVLHNCNEPGKTDFSISLEKDKPL